MYCAYITTIKELRKHSNADRLQCATVFGSNVIVDLSYTEGMRVVYFPVDGQLSEEFATDNNLVRKKDEQGNNIGGYLDPDKRNITALKLRGEKSDGLVLPIRVLEKYTDISKLKDGDQITVLDGHEICRKYIPRANRRRGGGGYNKAVNKKEQKETVSYPFFAEHTDTAQLAYNQNAFRPGDTIYLTQKLHGTSFRVSNAIEVTRKKRNDMFVGKLPKGMTVYGEIVGWVNESTPIMPRCANFKVKDKAFSKQYGHETVFTYGCEPGENDCYIYRITMTNEDGVTVELPTEETMLWCERLGVKYVPLLDKFLYTTWEDLNKRCEPYLDVPEPLANGSHVTEGVVVRIDNRTSFTAYKTKSFAFKVLEGIIKDNADAPDMEEAEELVANEGEVS